MSLLIRRSLAGLMALVLSYPFLRAQDYTFHSESDLVLVNVTVRDKSGNFVRGLKSSDFTILEDNKPQSVSSFDIEDIDAIANQNVAQARPLSGLAQPVSATGAQPLLPSTGEFKDRRLIVLFFDVSAMEPDEIGRAITSAENYIDKQMAPADLVAIVSLGSSLTVNQDFTHDHDLLKNELQAFGAGSGQGYEEGSTGTTEGTQDTGQTFTVDDTEYNIFNTDRRLEALRSVAEKLAHIQQKKSLVYFSSGMDRTGIENQSELRAAINAAVRSNLAIYTMDLRGLQALVPGGEAQNASLRGTSVYSGQSTLNALNSNFTTQETLVTLASDTGGKAFLDSNDFTQIFKAVQQDTSTYYLLGYRSSNPARDGKYRRIIVKLNISGAKIDYRRGYYAPTDYQHSTKEDREAQLAQQLDSELPVTDLPLYLSAAYFRLNAGKFYLPISLVVPGSQISFSRNSDKDKATLDILGTVTDDGHHPITRIRDTVKLAVEAAAEVRKKNVQYDTGVSLPPGKYHVKFVVRENETGRMGSFEAELEVPDLTQQHLKMSSVVLASQVEMAKKVSTINPLVQGGSEIVPNVTHVFSSKGHMRLYYEVYEPGRSGSAQKSSIHLTSSVALFRGRNKVFESAPVELTELNAADRKAGVFQLDLPLAGIAPGFYTCQVNVVDDVAGSFAFPRTAMLIRAQSPSVGK